MHPSRTRDERACRLRISGNQQTIERDPAESHKTNKENPIIKPIENNLLLSLLAMKDKALPAHPADQRRFLATGAEDGENRDWTTDGQSKRSGLEKEKKKRG